MVQSIFVDLRVLPFIAGSMGVCAVTILANRALSKIPYLTEGRRSMLASVAVTVLTASICTSMGWAAIATGAVAALIILGVRRRAAAPVVPGVLDRLNGSEAREISSFILNAIRDGRADRVRQLTRFLFGLPQFREQVKRIGLAVHLQEEILKWILHENRADLIDQIFLLSIRDTLVRPIQSELLMGIPSINADVAGIVGEYASDLIDEQGYFRILQITDGTLLAELGADADPRIQAFGRDGGLAIAEAAPSEGDFISVAVRNTPQFGGIVFSRELAL